MPRLVELEMTYPNADHFAVIGSMPRLRILRLSLVLAYADGQRAVGFPQLQQLHLTWSAAHLRVEAVARSAPHLHTLFLGSYVRAALRVSFPPDCSGLRRLGLKPNAGMGLNNIRLAVDPPSAALSASLEEIALKVPTTLRGQADLVLFARDLVEADLRALRRLWLIRDTFESATNGLAHDASECDRQLDSVREVVNSANVALGALGWVDVRCSICSRNLAPSPEFLEMPW